MSAHQNCCCEENVQTECCELPISRTIIATVTTLSSGCAEAFEGNDYPLEYNDDESRWEGEVEGLTVWLYCDELGTWRFTITGTGNCTVEDSPVNPLQQCEPFLLQYATSVGSDCCGTGTFIFEFTEG